jgi:hypothetical protein
MLRHKLWTSFRKLDIFLDKHAAVLAILLAVLVLRLPSFAEPYWYGDEAIYLTIANSIHAGERLYVDVIDHKTPLIYYIATLGVTQFGFRLLTLGAVAIATLAFFILIRDFFKRPLQQLLVMTIFLAYTNMPRFEGNIPNGELFVMMFVLLGLVVFRKTQLYQSFLTGVGAKTKLVKGDSQNTYALFGTGVLMGLAALTKVPAIFDFAVIFIIGWFVLLQQPMKRENVYRVVMQLGIALSGWITVISASIVYYALRGSLMEYIDFGLLYNFRYAGSWVPSFSSPIIAWLFTLKGKVVVFLLWLGFLSLSRNRLSRRFLLSGSWMALALFAATLSNRPYPHYFLQVFPALAIVVTVLATILWKSLHVCHRMMKTKELVCDVSAIKPLFEITASFLAIAGLILTMEILQVYRYPTIKYYEHFYNFMTKKITWEQYRNQFDDVLEDNYHVAKILRNSYQPETFIWGTNPLLYALSGKNPVGRFTVAFHIDDFNAYEETLQAVKDKQPTYIIVMKNQAPLPGLREVLMSEYIPNSEYSTMTVWRRTIH